MYNLLQSLPRKFFPSDILRGIGMKHTDNRKLFAENFSIDIKIRYFKISYFWTFINKTIFVLDTYSKRLYVNIVLVFRSTWQNAFAISVTFPFQQCFDVRQNVSQSTFIGAVSDMWRDSHFNELISSRNSKLEFD